MDFKRSKLLYYLKNVFLDSLPRKYFKNYFKKWLLKESKYSAELIKSRVSYYLNSSNKSLSTDAIKLKKITKKNHKSMYYYDFMKVARYFNQKFKVNYVFGDIDKNLDVLSFVKSRPIAHNGNSVLLPLDGFRHFKFIKDKKSFKEKNNEIVWRGIIHKENRRLLVEKFHNVPKFNVGSTDIRRSKKEWIKPYLSIKEQLEYKFILSIEGIDVATNLKWIMSSNSLCFMPKPKFETWFMEGKLIPNFHYVLIKDDYSDINEKMQYYSENINDSKKIIENAHQWVNQFRNSELEKLLSILVLNNYFKLTNQF